MFGVKISFHSISKDNFEDITAQLTLEAVRKTVNKIFLALRGILLIMMRERHANRYVVQMTRNEEIGTRWFSNNDFTVTIALKMKRDKDIQPG